MDQNKIDAAFAVLETLDDHEKIEVISRLIMTADETINKLQLSRTSLSRLAKDKEVLTVKRGVYLTSSIENRYQVAEKNDKYRNSLTKNKKNKS